MRYLDWARGLAARLGAAEATASESDALARYVAEIDNLRAAVSYAVSVSRDQAACELLDGIAFWALMRPSFEILEWFDVARIPAEEWTDAVAATAGVFAMCALFAGNAQRSGELLGLIPQAYEHGRWVEAAAVYDSLWVTGDIDRVERLLETAPLPPGTLEASSRMANEGQLFQTRLPPTAPRTRRTRHLRLPTARLVAEARKLGGDVGLSVPRPRVHTRELPATCRRRCCSTETVALGESAGSWFMVDAARFGLVESISRLASTDPSRLRETAATLRTTIEAALQRRTRFFVAGYLSGAVERLLWVCGDRRTAALLGTFGRLQFADLGAGAGMSIDPAVLGDESIAEIEAEARQLDVDAAGTIALAALDKIIDDH